uniref:Uncharacterized protein n=1 Tax=Acrobeloides nanus TaxID=290746 RepID=A0A914CCR3_9BILA
MMEQASASSWYNYRRKNPMKDSTKDKEFLDPYTPGVTPDLYKAIENQSNLKDFEHLNKKDKESLSHSMLEAYKNLKNPKNSWPFYHSK